MKINPTYNNGPIQIKENSSKVHTTSIRHLSFSMKCDLHTGGNNRYSGAINMYVEVSSKDLTDSLLHKDGKALNIEQ